MSYSAVIGAGTMGLGIAYVLAAAGDDVVLVEPDATRAADALPTLGFLTDSAVNKNKMTRTQAKDLLHHVSTAHTVRDLPPDGARLVVEAVPERVDLKQAILAAVEEHASPEVLATNTSGLSIAELARVLAHPERFLGLHFFNPVWVMSLVEIVRGPATSDATLADARSLVARIGKEAIVVNDALGFATSRLGVAIGLEAMRMLEDGVGEAADIDRAMELGYRHPMGPLRLSDLVGLDVRLDIARHLESCLGPRFSPPQILLDKVAAGELGKKSGKGFYAW